MKKVLSLLFSLLIAVNLAACGNTGTDAGGKDKAESKAPSSKSAQEAVSLEGEWREPGYKEYQLYHYAIIKDGVIEIYNMNSSGSANLYWAGTAYSPKPGETEFSWKSQNDTAKTSASYLACQENTKTFTYKDGKLSYEAFVEEGDTAILEKISDTPPAFLEMDDSSGEDSSETEATPESGEEPQVYKVGETWTVDGQWEMTITNVEKEEQVNPANENEIHYFYNISYTVKNLGFDDGRGILDGVNFSFAFADIVDNAGTEIESYSTGPDYEELPDLAVGESGDAKESIILETPDGFQIIMKDIYDDNRNAHSAIFQIDG